jgi:hypothetical protein
MPRQHLRLTAAQNAALAEMRQEPEPETPWFFGSYAPVLAAMARASDEMAEAAAHNRQVWATDAANAQFAAAHALNQAIDALEHAMLVLHGIA